LKVLLGLTAIPLLALLFWYGRKQLQASKRARLLKEPLSASYINILERNVGIYAQLPDELKTELHGVINVFLAEKQFMGCDGVDVTDEMRVTVAGLASVLLLNRSTRYYPGFSSVMIYPTAYMATEVSYDGTVAVERKVIRAGESWHRGPVILSWQDVLRGAANVRDGYNVVLHEFAHKLDEENNGTNGLPVLHEQGQYGEWAKVLGKEYESLEKRAARGKNKVLHEYGLTSPAEFFAVATESFFEKSVAMKKKLPDLYGQLKRFYHMDPASWV
jgi:Mlc titration factor MtfA (ptsG expression regulator)